MLVINGLTSADFFEGYFYQLVFLEGWQSPNLLLGKFKYYCYFCKTMVLSCCSVEN